jgi:hypothetical protein
VFSFSDSFNIVPRRSGERPAPSDYAPDDIADIIRVEQGAAFVRCRKSGGMSPDGTRS